MKRHTTEHPQITNRQKRINTDIITNPAPLTTEETNAKTQIGYGDVSKSAEPTNSALRDSSTLRRIPRMRELPWCTSRHHEPRTAPRAVVYRAQESTSLAGPGPLKKRTTYCRGVGVCAEICRATKDIFTLAPEVGADGQDGATEPASPRLVTSVAVSRRQEKDALDTHAHAAVHPSRMLS